MSMTRWPRSIGAGMSEKTENRERSFRAFFSNTLVQSLVLVTVIYWSLAIFVPGRFLIEIVTMALIGMFAVVIYRWAPVSFADLAEGRSGGRPQLMVGIVSLALSSIGILLWTLVWRYTGYPDWMIVSPFLGFMRLWSVGGAFLMVMSPSTFVSVSLPNNWRWVVLVVAVIACVFGFIAGSMYGEGIPDLPARFTPGSN
ncbi:hypothetical protein U0C82_03640 [Fulvimarina sp. 2208YS6-2-32]|uniref:Uncharacterized protein n=1 Tax=Fulvimarina uroteuthidis TaxID=3098149 RepID=A0ABU5HYN9_9HYPH|nr:hypothetical protein [Fulvimarina sp. 2208YS6-2-32]MDY8108241.1 hypothetical protein [Fulvimarina sp. 2208YS6-2-32]